MRTAAILNEVSSSQDDSYSIFPYETYKYLRDHTPEFEQLAAMEGGMSRPVCAARHGRCNLALVFRGVCLRQLL